MKKINYESSGVNKDAGYRSVNLIKDMVRKTYSKYVIGDLGGFAGCFEIPPGYKNPVLVSGTDGVGTKLIVAQKMGKHDTVGIDLVAMCVNDVICCGAKPLFFLDYIACGKNEPEKISEIVKGITDGCIDAECSLVGGETAEMPGMYDPEEYDLAGFCCAITEKSEMNFKTQEGDVLIALRSSGVHSNGFSLLRKVLFEMKKYTTDSYISDLGISLGEELLKPTNIYVKDIMSLKKSVSIKGMCNITGGGFIENVPRMVPDGLGAVLDLKTIEKPVIFDIIKKESEMDDLEMYSTFNMGVGFIAAVGENDVDNALALLSTFAHEPFIIGKIVKSEKKVELCR